MTPEMSFECLLVSHDSAVLSTIHRALQDFSIATKICFHASRAVAALSQPGTDLVILDFEDASSIDVLREIWKSGKKQKPTIIGVSTADQKIPGVHITVRKPITAEVSKKTLSEAYTRLLRDYRRNARFALMLGLTAMDDQGLPVTLTVMDIGYGGVGLRVKRSVRIGERLSFDLALPGARRSIYIQARVLWTRSFGSSGAEFIRVPPVDLTILHEWLGQRIRVKEPAILA